MADQTSAESLRLPPYFPRVPRECKEPAHAFFDCFTRESEYGPGKDPGVGRVALATCRELLLGYAACAEKHLTARQLELVQAPQAYRSQVSAATVPR